jgi:DNA-binding winged helix-turn-helix (wHTH) protein
VIGDWRNIAIALKMVPPGVLSAIAWLRPVHLIEDVVTRITDQLFCLAYMSHRQGMSAMPVGEKQTYHFGPFELDTLCGQLRKDGVGLKLQGQPVQILEILLERPSQLVTREELRQRLWTSDTFVDFDHSLNSAIKKLRQALGDEADTPNYIETLPRSGYRFIGELPTNGNVRRNSDETGIPANNLKRRAHRRRWIIVSFASLLAVGAVVYWLIQPPPMPRIDWLARTHKHRLSQPPDSSFSRLRGPSRSSCRRPKETILRSET